MGKTNVIAVDDDSFEAEVLRAEGPVLVDFGATWCQPCRVLEPIVERLADESVGALKVAKIDIDESPKVAAKYQVRGAPTVLVFLRGEKRAQHLGVTSRERLLELVAAAR